MQVLSMWWTIWKARNDFIHRSQPLHPHNIMGLFRKMLEGPTSYIGDHPNRKNGKLVEVPRVISNKEEPVIFSDAVYKAEGNASFGFIINFNNIIVDKGC
eukprot:TRINITY_DN13874_c2_g1_i1.p2 TRINITY_DN13874_c2_g1~~TRINITY_DN13874_c2_g1_i1.p2  ORF type:complete len:100 (+),score=12.88 TRINITY_DN13874_c2_g1_i1:1523-1822(+)